MKNDLRCQCFHECSSFYFFQIPIKNAVMMLNEMFPPPKAPQYKVTSKTGPVDNPTFTMVCTIEGQNFSGDTLNMIDP